MKQIGITTVLFSVFLVACSFEQESKTTVDNDKEAYEAYLSLKRIPLNDNVRYERMLEEYNNRKALADAMMSENSLDKALIDAEVEEFRRQLVISRYFESYLSENVTDQGIENFYKQNSEKYKSRKAHVAHILFRVNPDMGEIERKALLTQAHEAYSKISADEDFAEIAKQTSQDKVSAIKGGDLGWISEGSIAEEFSQKAFATKAGEITEPFLTAFGFHILKVIEEPQTITKPLESVKGDIRYQLRNEVKQAEIKRLITKTPEAK